MEEKCLAVFQGPLHIMGPQLNPSNARAVTAGTKPANPAFGIGVCKTVPLFFLSPHQHVLFSKPLPHSCLLGGGLYKAIWAIAQDNLRQFSMKKTLFFFSPASVSLSATLEPRRLPTATQELCNPSNALLLPQYAKSPTKDSVLPP